MFLIEVLEHLPPSAAPRTLDEVYRVLKADGILFLSTPNRRDLRSRLWGERRIAPKHTREYSLRELEEMLRLSHFEIKEERGIYLPLPIPKAEHYANVVPLRILFRWLTDIGAAFPSLAETIWIAAVRS